MDKRAKDFLQRDIMEMEYSKFAEAVQAIDPRMQNKTVYPASTILLMAMAGVIVGAQTWAEVADFSRANLDFFREYDQSITDAPSDDTFRRFFMIVDPDKLENLYRDWAKSLASTLSIPDMTRHVAIDGKTIRGAADPEKIAAENRGLSQGQIANAKLHMVSAYLADECVSLGQIKTDFKENEIVVIPKLIEALSIGEGDVVSIDAMGTQKKITEAISDKKAKYLLQVKGNQPALLEHIQLHMTMAEEGGSIFRNRNIAEFKESDATHGMSRTTECWAWKNAGYGFRGLEEWKDCNTFGRIVTRLKNKKTGETTVETMYFISSMEPDPGKLLKHKRKHWQVENGLHWQLDVSFNEDGGRKMMNSAQNYSTLTKIVLAIIKNDNSKPKTSVQRKRKLAGWNREYLKLLLGLAIKHFQKMS